jgi:hypothetical protein
LAHCRGSRTRRRGISWLGFQVKGSVAPLLWAIGAAVVCVGAIFGVSAARAGSVRRRRAGCHRAAIVGWVRVPDGCNFAVFDDGVASALDDPSFVVRLPLVRPALVADAVVARSDGMRSSCALFHADRRLIGIGRMRSAPGGRRVWQRRHRRAPKWIGRGPWEPPAI